MVVPGKPVCALSGANVFTGAAPTLVTSNAELLALLAAGSLPPATVTELVTDGTAVEATATVSVIGLALVAPAAITPALVQVTSGGAETQAQPVPVAETKVSPVGSVSVT